MKPIVYKGLIIIAICALTLGVVELLSYVTHSDKVGDWAFYVIVCIAVCFGTVISTHFKKRD